MFPSSVCLACEISHYWLLFAFIFSMKIILLVGKLIIAFVKLF